jgi:hypothetical protein
LTEAGELVVLGEAGGELSEGGEDELADVGVGVGGDEDALQKVDNVLLAHGLARRRRPILLISCRRRRSTLKENVAVLSDGPDTGEGERFLRDVGFERGVELVDGVGLEVGGVGDEADEGGEDFLADVVASL